MKCIIVFVFVALFFSFSVNSEPVKRALIVAIGDYPVESGWKKLNSLNDVTIVKAALIHQGFHEKNIVVLTDKEATRAGIVKALDQMIERSKAGDIVYFHFSGHGQQMADDNGDEIDGLDEALVPIDAWMKFETSPAKGANHLRDDQLGMLFDKLRNKLGVKGDLIVALDACHSGTATRGNSQCRGTQIIFAPPGFSPSVKGNIDNDISFLESKIKGNYSPIIIMAGSSASELNYETAMGGVKYGSLSYALSEVLTNLEPLSTYRGFFGRIQVKMQAMYLRQTPQLEGDANRYLFAGNAITQQQYITVDLWEDEKTVTINAGNLNGLYDHSTVEFHPIGTMDPKQSKAKSSGIVVESQLARALVVLDQPLKHDEALNSWVFIKKQSFSKFNISINISAQLSDLVKNQLRRTFQESRFITFVENDPEISVEQENDRISQIVIYTKDNQELFRKSISSSSPDRIATEIYDRVRLYAQAKFIRSLDHKRSGLKVSFEIIPVIFDTINNKAIPKEKNLPAKPSVERLVFNEGDYFILRITNNSKSPAYYSMIMDFHGNKEA